MSDMLVRCDGSYVVSVSGSGIVVVGGAGGEHLNDVQVFDGESHTWHRGTLPFSSLTVQCDVKDVVFSKEEGGTLAVCGVRLVWIGGVKDVVLSKEVKELREGDGPSCQTCW